MLQVMAENQIWSRGTQLEIFHRDSPWGIPHVDAPWGIPIGFPMDNFHLVFQYGTLVFSPPDAILGAQVLDLGSSWAGDFFAQKWDPEKHDFVEEMVPHGV